LRRVTRSARLHGLRDARVAFIVARFRELGVALFFAAVGLTAGPMFFTSVFSAAGLLWLVTGLGVTVLPLLLVGFVARAMLHMNFAVLGGLLAGSVTDRSARSLRATAVFVS